MPEAIVRDGGVAEERRTWGGGESDQFEWLWEGTRDEGDAGESSGKWTDNAETFLNQVGWGRDQNRWSRQAGHEY